MRKYVEITDKGECMSTLNAFFINGSLANRTAWERHNYYPQDGQVGELVESSEDNFIHTYSIQGRCIEMYILKINNDIYVPMTKNGIKIISENEYNLRVGNNIFHNGKNSRQQKINSDYDNAMSGLLGIDMIPGAYHDAFWSDICQILKRHTDDFTIPMYHKELVHECLMYALDMCRHFERTAGFIRNARKEYIASEVCNVFLEHFDEFTDQDAAAIINRVCSFDSFEPLSANIDKFYSY